jgi:diguanylate cyclase (GGDEF)-like protein
VRPRGTTIARIESILRLDSIRSKIISFAVLATLLPSLGMGWLSYRNNLRVLEEKITQELGGITHRSSREIDLWLKERQYEIRVFASSYEVAENLERISGAPTSSPARTLALNRLADYLKSVEGRFSDYDELAVLDPSGAVVATSEPGRSDLALPPDWEQTLRSDTRVAGKPYWDPNRGAATMILAEPVHGSREGLLGLLAARLNLQRADTVLKSQAPERAEQLHVITRDGMILASFPPLTGVPSPPSLPADQTKRLFSSNGSTLELVDAQGQEVVAALQVVGRVDWGVVAAKDRATEFAEISRVRNVTIVLMASILIGIGAAASVLGLTLVRPLNRLIRGAGKVAGGDLDVDLPVSSGGEVGYLTVVFNHMVARLRTAREEIEATNRALLDKNQELHEISITDGLTGLHNRKHMNETVVAELARAERHNHPVSVLMMDIDHFKEFNDTFGHQDGDELLIGLAKLLRETLRTTDYAARYGGEEFLILLPHIALDEAVQTAERIRSRIEDADLGGRPDSRPVTISIGVATFPGCGKDGETVIRAADVALYQAKRKGRNRVVPAVPASSMAEGSISS